MSTFTLAISCLTTSNLPWFMDLAFQVPMQYRSLLHRTLLLSLVTSTTGCCFCFGSIPSFYLELFLHWSPVALWAPTDLGILSFSVLRLPIHTVHVVLKARILKWFAIPFFSGPHSDLSTMTRPSWVAPHGMAWFHCRQGCGPVRRLAGFLWLWFQGVCPLMPSRNTYHLTWVSLTLDVEVSPHGCSSKAQSLLLTLDEGCLLTGTLLTLSVEWLFCAFLRPHSCHSLDMGLTCEMSAIV